MSKVATLEQMKAVFDTDPKTNYKRPTGTKIIDQRRSVSYKGDRTSYIPGETMVIQIGSTTEFVNGQTSYLNFKLKVQGNALGVNPAGVGIGSAINALESITLTSKSGLQIEQILDLSALAHMRDSYTTSENFIRSQGTAWGYRGMNAGRTALETDSKYNVTDVQFDAAGSYVDVCIPLSHISGFFSQNKLIPISVLSGIEMRIVLADKIKAFFNATGPIVNYSVAQVQVVCDNFRMAPAVLKLTENLAKTSELIMMFDTYQWNMSPILANTAHSINVGSGLSRILSVYAKPRPSTAITGQFDALLSSTTDITSYQFKVGSNNYPEFPITSSTVSYFETLQSFNTLCNCVRTPLVSLNDFNNGYKILGVQLERDTTSDNYLSGLSTLHKNVISLEITSAAAANVTTFVHFVKMLTVSTDGLRVEQ